MSDKQLPEGWRLVKFGEMAKHISKRVEPSETNLNIYVGLEHLDPDSLRIKRHGVPSDVEGQKLLVKKGQIIFGKRRAYQRKLGVADWDCICSAHAMVLEANSETVLPEFLPFFMQSDVFMNRAVAISEGSLSPTIKWKVLSEQKFLFPDRVSQEKILPLLYSSEQNLNESEQSSDFALTAFQRVIDSLLTNDRHEKPKTGWMRTRLKNLVSINSSQLSNKTPQDTKLRYIDISSIDFPGSILNIQSIDFCEAPSRARRVLKKHDIVVSTVRPNHRATFYVTDQIEGAIASTGFSVLTAKDQKLSKLIYYCTLTKQFAHSLTNLAVGTSFPAITDGDILSQRIDIPSEDELDKIEHFIGSLENIYKISFKKYHQAKQLKMGILNKIFTPNGLRNV
ncbi:MAG: restriction endonuclease subunit S [Methylovulum sp.]